MKKLDRLEAWIETPKFQELLADGCIGDIQAVLEREGYELCEYELSETYETRYSIRGLTSSSFDVYEDDLPQEIYDIIDYDVKKIREYLSQGEK